MAALCLLFRPDPTVSEALSPTAVSSFTLFQEPGPHPAASILQLKKLPFWGSWTSHLETSLWWVLWWMCWYGRWAGLTMTPSTEQWWVSLSHHLCLGPGSLSLPEVVYMPLHNPALASSCLCLSRLRWATQGQTSEPTSSLTTVPSSNLTYKLSWERITFWHFASLLKQAMGNYPTRGQFISCTLEGRVLCPESKDLVRLPIQLDRLIELMRVAEPWFSHE